MPCKESCTSSNSLLVEDIKSFDNRIDIRDLLKKNIDDKLSYSSIKNHEISKLFRKYQGNFNKVSGCFENWGKHRRGIIEKLSTNAVSVKRTRQNCYKGIFAFSSISAITAAVGLLMDNVNKRWTLNFLIGASALGSLSFFCSLIDVCVCKLKVEEIELAYREDKFALDDLEREIRFGAVNNDIHDFFPNGVNYNIVKNMIEPQLMNRKEWLYFKNLFLDIELASDDEKIFYAIVLSNIRSDPDLLNDKDFLGKVKNFSKSTLAEKWWNRLKYENSSHHSEKMKLLSEIKSFLKPEKLFIPALQLAVLPLSNDIFINTAALVLVNCIISFDAFSELAIKTDPKESSTFKSLQRVLQIEYDELKKVYDLLNPYND